MTEEWTNHYHYIEWNLEHLQNTLPAMTMIYTAQQTQQLADEMVEREEKATKKELSEEEKERLWNLIKSSVEGG